MTAPTAGSGPTHPPGHPGTGGPPPPPPPKDSLPSLIELASLVRSVLDGAIHMLGGQYDPTTGPSQQDDPWGPEAVDISLGCAVADVRSAVREIDAVVALLQPASTYPGPSDSSACLSGGSASHLTAPSVAVSGGRTPGLVDAAASDPGGTDGSGAVAPGRDAGADFTLPVTKRFTMPGTERIARSINEALTGRSW